MQKIGIDKAVHEFEQVFETLDVKADSMNAALDGVHSSSMSQTSVDELMAQLKEEQVANMQNSGPSVSKAKVGGQEVKDEDDDLMARLRNLQS